MPEIYQLMQMQYRTDPNTGEQVEAGQSVQRLSDGACIPPDGRNRDYAQFLIDKEAGAEVRDYVEPPPPVPSSISDIQFFWQLHIMGIISEDDAIKSNQGVIPAPLLDLINEMPEEKRGQTKMKISGSTVYYRENEITKTIGALYGMTEQQIDEFFIAASKF